MLCQKINQNWQTRMWAMEKHWHIWLVPNKKISNKIITTNEIKKVFSTLRAQSSIPFYFQWTNCTLTHRPTKIHWPKAILRHSIFETKRKKICLQRKKIISPNESVHFCVSCGPAYHIPQGIFVRVLCSSSDKQHPLRVKSKCTTAIYRPNDIIISI